MTAKNAIALAIGAALLSASGAAHASTLDFRTWNISTGGGMTLVQTADSLIAYDESSFMSGGGGGSISVPQGRYHIQWTSTIPLGLHTNPTNYWALGGSWGGGTYYSSGTSGDYFFNVGPGGGNGGGGFSVSPGQTITLNSVPVAPAPLVGGGLFSALAAAAAFAMTRLVRRKGQSQGALGSC